MNKTAKEYYNRTENGDFTGMSIDCTYRASGTKSILYTETGTSRMIDITEVNNDYSPYIKTVQVFPSLGYYENYCIGENKGTRIDEYSHSNLLGNAEIQQVVSAFMEQGITPFIFTVEPGNRHAVYHPPLQTETERRLSKVLSRDRGMELLPVAQLPPDADITNISALGLRAAVAAVEQLVLSEAHLVAYAGNAVEGEDLYWIDIHHSAASKGGAIAQLKVDLGVSRVICFGDSDNDLSMFSLADESYAPSNAKAAVKAAATAVIGHHDEDGISQFLRQRFDLIEQE